MRDVEKKLLDGFQRGLPLVPKPYAEMGRRLGISEAEVIDALSSMCAAGIITRVGAVFKTGTVGASTLAAMAVPPERLVDVARVVSAYEAVNHNYEREHRLNLWFVVTAPDGEGVRSVLDDIAARTGLEVLDLPMEEDFHLDLGFALQWH